MCGFCGVIGPERTAEVGRVGEMARALAHRGPDDQGSWNTAFPMDGAPYQVGLGHARLSILDLSSAGHQPMLAGGGKLAVAYNGEIYNFRELRKELVALGHRFASECDTEVLLEAYHAWGIEAFPKLQGMFAFALWDSERQRLYLVRDRLGIKPLYYQWRDGLLLFGSELGSLRRHPAFRAEIDPGALGLYLRHGYVVGPGSIYRDTWRLPPGSLLVWERGNLHVEPYWKLVREREPTTASSYEEAVDQLEELLGDAVEQRLISDVPLGAFLSGGIDSSTVVALMKSRARGAVRSFTIGFSDPSYNEAHHARAIADHLGTEHTDLIVTRAEAVSVAREIPRLYDEPFADASAIPTTLLSRLTRESVTVALSGDGGDELFCGYDTYDKLARLAPLMRLPFPLRKMIAGFSQRLLPQGALRNGLGHLAGRDLGEVAYRLLSALDEETLAVTSGSGSEAPSATYFDAYRGTPSIHDLQRSMLADASTYLPDDILCKVDRASMSVGLEARVPLLDHRVVDFAFSLPLQWLRRNGGGKALLRSVLHRHVPAALFERPKQGFGIPIQVLLRKELREWSETYLAPDRLREEGNLDPSGVARILEGFAPENATASQAEPLWSLLCFQRWFAFHHRGERISD